MSSGFVGERSRKRKRYQLFFFLLILLIVVIVLFIINVLDTDEEIVTINERIPLKENSILVKRLETELFLAKQRLQIREGVVNNFKDQIKVLEENNDELISTIRLLNSENTKTIIESQKSQKKNSLEIEKLHKTINKLNKEINQINDIYFSIKKENDMIKNKISIIENNNKTLELQKDIAFEQIKELKQNVIEKDKLIIEKDKLIKEMKDKIHH